MLIDKTERYSRHKRGTLNPCLRNAVKQGAWQQAMPNEQKLVTKI